MQKSNQSKHLTKINLNYIIENPHHTQNRVKILIKNTPAKPPLYKLYEKSNHIQKKSLKMSTTR